MTPDRDDPARILAQALDRIERRLADATALARVNALLSLADPGLVLPSPALALLELDPAPTTRLHGDWRFRVSDARSALGDVMFTPVERRAEVHPWSIREAHWLDEGRESGSEPEDGTRLAAGLTLCLERDPDVACAPGRLALHIEGGAALPWALEEASATCADRPLRTSRLTPRLTADRRHGSGMSISLRCELAALAENILFLEIPGDLVTRSELRVTLRFAEPISALREIEAHSNVLPLWNSLRHVHPDPADVEQSVTGRRRLVHALTTESLGVNWVAWDVVRVGTPRSPGGWRDGSRGNEPAERPYHLAFVPLTGDILREPLPPACLSVVVNAERADDDRLMVEFRATQGSSANGIPLGTRLQTCDRSLGIGEGGPAGSLFRTTWGGTDGLARSGWEELPAEALHAFLPGGTLRVVSDVSHALAARFGDEIELVDEWDLLRGRPGAGLSALRVRVAFRRPDCGPEERRAVLRAGQMFLRHYLGSNAGSRLVLCEAGQDGRTGS